MVHSVSHRKTVPLLTRVEPHVSPSCPLMRLFFFFLTFEIRACRRVTRSFSVFRSAAAPLRQGQLWSHTLKQQPPPTHTHKIYVFPARHPHPWRLRTPDYAIERIIHHYGVPEVVSSSCLFSTMGYFHTGASHLAFLQDIFTFSGNTRSVVGVLHSKSDYQPKQDKFSMCERELRSS